MLPFPIVDKERPWGGTTCDQCKGTCAGHYKTVLTDVFDKQAMNSTAPLPSTILKQEFRKAKKPVSETFLQNAARKALLSIEDTKIWLDHLQTVLNNRKRGARKAAATRQARKIALLDSGAQSDLNCEQNYCGLCGKEYVTGSAKTRHVRTW